MSIIRERFKLSTLSLAVLSSMSMQAAAFEEEKQDENVEVIEVEGFRGSLMKSMNNKRNSTNVSDAIFAEDIGKTSDQNIADALGRVTGVSIVSRDGEGAQVSVRGASSTQNQITLNGQQLSSTDFNQSVDLSSFSADILSKLEVVKTPSADHEEGSLGASVNLVTVRPLDVSEETLSGTIQGRYNDLSAETDYKLQLSLTEKFLDDTLGLAFTISDETNSYRKDQYISGSYEASELNSAAVDQDGNLLTDVRAIHAKNHSYRLNRNTSDRLSASLGVQYFAGEETELMFNATYSKQTRETQYDGLTVRTAGSDNFIEGVKPQPSDTRSVPAPFTDPADWLVINTDTNSIVSRLDRFGVGDIQRSVGGTENENLSLSLNVQHQISDNLAVSGQIGYSDSHSESLPSIFTNLQNFIQVNGLGLEKAGEDGQPVGYDCTSGQCEIIAGTALIDVGENITDYVDRDGINRSSASDNTNVLTGFNPADPNTFHLGNFSENDTTVDDTIKSAQIDFDYDLYEFGLTTIEFGAKISSREKFVDNQSYTFNSITKSGPITNEAGINIGQPSGPLNNIRAIDILDPNGLGVDDFMSSLGVPASHVTRNSVAIDVVGAFELVSDTDELVRSVDNSRTRSTELDTKALYLKTNFSFFDDALTGDIGVRYVETEIAAAGFSGGQFHDFPQHADESEFDWLTLRNLRDRSLPECPRIDYIDDTVSGTQVENKFGRVDGTGWQTNGSWDPQDWTRLPMFDPNGDGQPDPCHDANYAQWAEDQRNGVTYTGDFPIDWQTMWRYADVSVSNDNGWNTDLTTPNISWNGNEGGLWKDYVVENTVNKSITSFASADNYEYDNVLPSLNLNYAISDELIARFAVSRTMTRPELEDTRAGFSFNQLWSTFWGGGPNATRNDVGKGRVDLFNTRLDPLESDNLDLSLEWYFNDASMVSVAFFKKDMENFVDTESILNQYITDLRNIEGSLAISDLIIDESDTAALENCQPVRSTTEFGFKTNTPVSISDDLLDICHQHTINRKFNGDSASIEGVELSYSQVYDFLPGFLSGLGLQANYTYQDSEYAPQESTLIPGTFLPSVPVADTPKHSYNASLFWEQDGHQVRLSYRASSDSLVGINWNEGQNSRGRTWSGGSLWNEGRETFDLSATYQINEDASLTFQAINLFDEDYRVYYTSRELEVDKVLSEDGTSFEYQALNEGNPLEGDATKDRTYDRYKVGSIYRLGLRVNF